MADENEVLETSEASTPDGAPAPDPTPETVDLDQKIRVGGEEFSATEVADAFKNYGELQEYAQNLEAFQQATMRLMNPETSVEVKKQDARNILLASNYPPEKVDEWVKIYDQEQPVADTAPQSPQQSQPDPAQAALQNATQKNNEEDEIYKEK